MKKQQLKTLKLGKTSISNLVSKNLQGGAPTTDQSQYCPNDPLPWTFTCPHSLDEAVCTRSANSICYSRCNGC